VPRDANGAVPRGGGHAFSMGPRGPMRGVYTAGPRCLLDKKYIYTTTMYIRIYIYIYIYIYVRWQLYIVVVLLRMRNEMWESCRSFTYVEIVAQLGRIVSVYKNVTTIFKNISCIIHNCIDMFTSI
jgi:hypothetical protein